MPAVSAVLFREGSACQLADWFNGIPEKAYAKGMGRVRRLAALGHELRRPEADYLEEGIYELRWRLQTVNYRVLYFFQGRDTAVLSHGFTKEDRIPPREIDLALRHKAMFMQDPEAHTYREALP